VCCPLRLEETNFPEARFLSATDTKKLLREFAEAGLAGGALYDGLVGAAARQHKLMLTLTRVMLAVTRSVASICPWATSEFVTVTYRALRGEGGRLGDCELSQARGHQA